ncbi:hypothetical protein EOD39_2355 [Acipenser ruthenus]|uniref:Uncharacterized protein n=1 Tax=Acipenser ruthenus TaxID=7906 RepID=A0A444U271_ACIRT|nr:hypothetical protein EOD39_2355 [Acipenser ruthenus]
MSAAPTAPTEEDNVPGAMVASTDEVNREAVDIVVKYFNSIARIPKAFRLESVSPVTGLKLVRVCKACFAVRDNGNFDNAQRYIDCTSKEGFNQKRIDWMTGACDRVKASIKPYFTGSFSAMLLSSPKDDLELIA